MHQGYTPPMPGARSNQDGTTIGVDTGGTFTDLVRVSARGLEIEKVPSTPDDPSRAVLDGIERMGGELAGAHVIHGTTVALNALLSHRTARTALVCDAGFRDLIEIGRMDRPELYDLHPEKPAPLVPRELRFEVGSRSWPDPRTRAPVRVTRPSARELAALARELRDANVEAVAVCLLHSYADPEPEREVARALAKLGVPITCSGELLAEYREVERFSTAVVNAALVPVMRAYLERLSGALAGARLSLLQSNGGTLPAQRAAVEPVRVLLSGPAGGVVGALRAAREAGFARMVGLDMGGTSTDVAFRAADAPAGHGRDTPEVAGHPVAVPSLDIHTIGCGGGSLVEVDAGGVLRVGPGSAGADPGPVCYGASDRPTLTDAHVQLGHAAAGSFLGGRLELDVDAVARAFEQLGARLGIAPDAAAQAVLDVGRASMRRAVGVMTMQRGEDPARLPLVCFGGAGGLQAAALAQSLGMAAALVPRGPGVLSALGLATADAIREGSRSLLVPLDQLPARERRSALAGLVREARESLLEAGHTARSIEVETFLDLRYAGQSFEIQVEDRPAGRPIAQVAANFHARHEALYGYRLADRPIELVCLRARASVRRPEPDSRAARPKRLPAAAIRGGRRVAFPADAGRPRWAKAQLIDRAQLAPGHRFEGPAIVEEYSGTTLVPPGWEARVAPGEHLVLRPV